MSTAVRKGLKKSASDFLISFCRTDCREIREEKNNNPTLLRQAPPMGRATKKNKKNITKARGVSTGCGHVAKQTNQSETQQKKPGFRGPMDADSGLWVVIKSQEEEKFIR